HRRIVAVVHEMVLGQPQVVVAEFVEHRGLIEHRGVQLGIWPPPLLGIAEVVHHAEFNRAVLLATDRVSILSRSYWPMTQRALDFAGGQHRGPDWFRCQSLPKRADPARAACATARSGA